MVWPNHLGPKAKICVSTPRYGFFVEIFTRNVVKYETVGKKFTLGGLVKPNKLAISNCVIGFKIRNQHLNRAIFSKYSTQTSIARRVKLEICIWFKKINQMPKFDIHSKVYYNNI